MSAMKLCTIFILVMSAAKYGNGCISIKTSPEPPEMQEPDDDYDYHHSDYSDYEVDYCDIENTYYDSGYDDICQHGDFTNIPKVNELSKYSDSTKFRPCCEIESKMKHGYLHKDQCKKRDTYAYNLASHSDSLRFACGAPKTQPMHSEKISCPFDCKMVMAYMSKINLTVDINGSKTIDDLTDVKVHDFCVGYYCSDNNYYGAPDWIVIAKTCICFEKNLWNQAYTKLAEIDLMFGGNQSLSNKAASNAKQSDNSHLNNLQTCCKGNSSVIRSVEDFSHPKFSNFSDSYIFCAESSNKLELAENRFCTYGEWDHKEISDKGYEVKNENGAIVLSKNRRPTDSLDINSNYYCVGVGISKHPGVLPHRHKAKPVPIVKTCVPPCQGKTPCIRLCPACPMGITKNHWIKEIKGYKKYKDGDGNLGSKCLNLRGHTAKTFSGNTSESLLRHDTHFVDYQINYRYEIICPEGFIAKRLNEPECKKSSPNCTNTNPEDERFNLTENTLVMLKSGRSYRTDQFCIHPNPDAESKYDHFATVCVEITKSK